MIGFPKSLTSKKDWENAVSYAIENKEGKGALISRLENLRDNIYIKTLKESSKEKSSEEQTPDDYEEAEDPNPTKKRLGIDDVEINKWIKELEA